MGKEEVGMNRGRVGGCEQRAKSIGIGCFIALWRIMGMFLWASSMAFILLQESKFLFS